MCVARGPYVGAEEDQDEHAAAVSETVVEEHAGEDADRNEEPVGDLH